jgi:hypothetical protein
MYCRAGGPCRRILIGLIALIALIDAPIWPFLGLSILPNLTLMGVLIRRFRVRLDGIVNPRYA